MKILINLATLATYAIVCYFTISFLIHALSKVGDFMSGIQFVLTSAIIILVTALSGYFCVKIIIYKDE
jgi:hypothetical protein